MFAVYVRIFDEICTISADSAFLSLVSSLFSVAIDLLKSVFTFPSFQSSSCIYECSLLMVLEAFLEYFLVVSSEVTSNLLK